MGVFQGRAVDTGKFQDSCRVNQLMVTEYLLENGVTVPKILLASIKKDGTTLIVREYFKGLTGQELNHERKSANPNLPLELSDSAWKLLEPEIDRLKNLFSNGHDGRPSFKNWYLASAPRLLEKHRESWNVLQELSLKDPQLMARMDDILFMHDFNISNLLFDIQRDRWIAYDP